ncbi:hypothetical protein EC917_12976 [Bacillus thuringiensis]|nr:hypothetical protein EC917_12976 [Bacillus thuringiensis]
MVFTLFARYIFCSFKNPNKLINALRRLAGKNINHTDFWT